MRSELRNIIRKRVTLETVVSVAIQSHFLKKGNSSFFVSLDENGDLDKNQTAAALECLEQAQPLIDEVVSAIAKWKRHQELIVNEGLTQENGAN